MFIQKSLVSQIVSYVFIAALTIGLYIIVGIIISKLNNYGMMQGKEPYMSEMDFSTLIMYINPFYTIASILPYANSGGFGMLMSFGYAKPQILMNDPWYLTTLAKGIYFNLGATLAFYFLAVERLKPIKRKLINKL